MASFKQSDWGKGRKITPVADSAGDVVCETFIYNLAAALVINDVIEMGILPAHHRILDAMIDCDDLDSGGTGLTMDVGIMSGDVGEDNVSRTVGKELFDATTAGQAAGMVRTALGQRAAKTDLDRSIGILIKSAPTTSATTGTIRLTVFYGE